MPLFDYSRHLKHVAQIQTRARDKYGELYVTDTTTVACLLYEEDDEREFSFAEQTHVFKDRVIFEPDVTIELGNLIVSVVDKDGVEVLDVGELKEIESYHHHRYGKSFVSAGIDVD
jgi:hypothetical protein